MKKLLWIVLALCLLVVPAMAEEECDHEGAEWAELWAPGCTWVGGEGAWCNKCMTYVMRDIPAVGHKAESMEETVAPTCEGVGKKEGICIYCESPFTEDIPSLGGHTVTEWTIVAGPAPCIGRIVQKFGACEVCGEEDWVYESGEATGEHEYSEKGMTMEEPTCTEPGLAAHMCELCGQDAEEREIPALGHDESRMIEKEPATCTEPGLMYGHCPVCEAELSEEIPSLGGHTVTEWETVAEPAACMGYDGQKIGDCDVCHEQVWETIPFEGEILGEHVFETYMEMEAATCTVAGTEMSLCSLCGREDDVREIPALGHDDSEMEVTKEATCTVAGEKVGKCSRCGEEGEAVEIPALGHTEVWTNTTEPTCTEAGEAAGTCSVCEADLGTKAVDALGHDDGEWVVTKEATREAEGLKELKCTRCDEVLDSEVIPMVTIVWYSDNTACVAGTGFRTLANVDTNKWYTFVELDLSQDGVQTFDLIASNIYRIGTVTVTVAEGNVTVDYDLCTDEIIVHDEFMTLFASLEDVTTVDQAAFTEYAYGEAINIQEALNGTTGYLYLCNVVTYHDEMLRIERVW